MKDPRCTQIHLQSYCNQEAVLTTLNEFVVFGRHVQYLKVKHNLQDYKIPYIGAFFEIPPGRKI